MTDNINKHKSFHGFIYHTALVVYLYHEDISARLRTSPKVQLRKSSCLLHFNNVHYKYNGSFLGKSLHQNKYFKKCQKNDFVILKSDEFGLNNSSYKFVPEFQPSAEFSTLKKFKIATFYTITVKKKLKNSRSFRIAVSLEMAS